MFKYKNIGKRKIIFQAGADAEKGWIKKFYEVGPGAIIKVPVLLNPIDNLELVTDDGVNDEGKRKGKK